MLHALISKIDLITPALCIATVLGLFGAPVNQGNSSKLPTSMRTVASVSFVAHAGGVTDGYSGSNCLEALEESVRRGFKLIEVDIIKTSDDQHVLSHDWKAQYNRVPLAEEIPVTQSEFEAYRIFNKYTAMTLVSLINFLDKHPQILIITDTKARDYSSLAYIASVYPQYVNRFIPQIYSFDDYDAIKSLGYEKIIATAYEMPNSLKTSPAAISAYAEGLDLFAMVIPDELMQNPTYTAQLNFNAVSYGVHTINDPERAEALIKMGVKFIYTDYLYRHSIGLYQISIAEKTPLSAVNRIYFLNSTMQSLSVAEKRLLSDCLIYEIGSEVVIDQGTARMINELTPASCFVNPNTHNAYLPFMKTIEFLRARNISYLASINGSSFEYNDYLYTIRTNQNSYEKSNDNGGIQMITSEKITIFCDMFFASEAFFQDVFNCRIIKAYNGFVVVTQDKTASDEAYGALIQKLQAQ